MIGARMAKGEAEWLAEDEKMLASCTGMTPSNCHRPAGRGEQGPLSYYHPCMMPTEFIQGGGGGADTGSVDPAGLRCNQCLGCSPLHDAEILLGGEGVHGLEHLSEPACEYVFDMYAVCGEASPVQNPAHPSCLDGGFDGIPPQKSGR